MATTAVFPSRIAQAEPYKGDDWAQSLSRWMATPMFLMGAMAVALSLALGIAGGVSIADFFGSLASPDFDDLGRAEALAQLSGAVAFLGMGFILGGIVMHLVNVVRTLRDAGRDVQRSLGAEPLKLRKPWSGHLTPHVMLMGVMAEVAAFVVGIVAALSIGGVNPAAIADPASATAADLADIGVARAAALWLPGLRLAGIATLLASVVLVLLTIQKVLRFQAARITELATGGHVPVASSASQPVSIAAVPDDQLSGWRAELHQRLGRPA